MFEMVLKLEERCRKGTRTCNEICTCIRIERMGHHAFDLSGGRCTAEMVRVDGRDGLSCMMCR